VKLTILKGSHVKLTILKGNLVKLIILKGSHVKLTILKGSHVKLTILEGSHVKLTTTTTLKIVLACVVGSILSGIINNKDVVSSSIYCSRKYFQIKTL
jgi:hypothetical protein